MLLRRIGGLACLLLALAAMVAADAAARFPVTHGSESGGLPGVIVPDAPSYPAWWSAPHPPRTVQVDVTVSQSDDRYEVIADQYDVTLRPGDPLIELVRSGDVDANDLAVRLAGSPYYVGDQATLQYADSRGEAHVSFVNRHAHDWSIGVRFHAVPASLGAPGGVRRTVRVEAHGSRIGEIHAGAPIEQDGTHVVLTGTGEIDLTLIPHDPPAAAPSAPSDAETPRLNTNDIARGMVLVMPWLAVALIRRRSGLRRLANAAAVFVVGGTAVDQFAVYTEGTIAGRVGFGLFCLALPLFLLAAARAAGLVRPAPGDVAVAALAAAGAALVPAGLVATTWAPSPVLAGAALAVGPIAGAAAAALLARRWTGAGAAVGLACVSLVLGVSSVLYLDVDSTQRSVVGMAVGLIWALMIGAPLVLRRPWWLAGALVAGAVLLISPGRLAQDPVRLLQESRYPTLRWPVFDGYAIVLADVVLAVILVMVLARAGRDGRALQDRALVAAAVAAVMCAAVDFAGYGWSQLAGIGALWAGLLALLPAPGPHHRLVTAATHARLVRAELRRRMLRTAAADVYRGARARLAGGQDAIEEYDGAQARLDGAVTDGGRPVDGVPVGEAFTTDAGRTPVQNALAAIGYAAPVAVLLMTYEVVAVLQRYGDWLGDLPLNGLSAELLHLLRWPAYAALFGYCYPLLRGRGPLTKTLNLAALVLVAELVPILADPSTEGHGWQLVVAVLVRAGQVLVFFVVLGLLWERRLAVLADVGWNRLRDLRRATTLAAPVGTIVLTVVTALGTALAGAAAAALIANQSPNPPGAPRPAPSVSSSR